MGHTVNTNLSIKAVDLFCGAGGLTHGLIKSGINVVAGYDIEESCRFAYEHNNNATFINQDVTSLSGDEVLRHLKNADYTLLAGCAPCQPFSTYSRAKKTTKNHQDNRWNLLASFGRLIAEVLPDFVTMENVPGLADQKVFIDFLAQLNMNGYSIDYKIVFCPDYGMAQTRKRLVLIASRLGKISLPKPSRKPDNYLNVADVISHLPKIGAGDTCKNDPLHKSSVLSPINIKRIKASVPGGSWMDWPEELRASCHKKDTGKTYISVYGRMSWNTPAPTITTQCNGFGNGRFGHPEQDRAISLREAAILQSFPADYHFHSKNTKLSVATLAKMIGNAVPVRLGEIVGQSIKSSLAHI
ncbi:MULTISPECIES: DNA cytosine methyltransferase [Yersinia]|uniref:DNA (cytosine-5-)-methyltransferase n=1 Tax=Yersinia aldovae TaxID=29483 RepID=A0A0T9SW19_YERAL|nr:DNA cytosine methyltransferase [Yersinia enterocolitica]CNK42175.1 Cytosine-specific methyltransferase [Yersinia aldovae]CNK48759.1 Cytosine-specific methyltransferase [Yersinia aldovae]HDL7329933.1 DNA cytosine methyltransferase [Yersinia enterocolitica]HDL7356347.1 DNA cytosine methyltransferase [Yersinia enterocolitica]